MSRMRGTLWRGFIRAERTVDRTMFAFRRKFGLFGPVHVYPYRGFGTKDQVWLFGRILVDRGLEHATEDDSLWKNFRMSVKRFASDEIPGVRVRVRFGDAEEEVLSDTEGYYTSKIEPIDLPDSTKLWHPVEVTLVDPLDPRKDRLRAIGEAQIPSPACDIGIISDVDDTVIRTEATSALTMLRLTLFHNAHSRTPFAGVSAFYRALQVGASRQEMRPFFYVSSSPWNLYDLLVDIFDLQDLPAGTFFLRDLGFDESKFVKSKHDAHKLAEIERVMTVYPDMQFVLIGDSGQRDPEIYQQVVADFPGRVKVIYIRDVKPEITGARDTEVRRISDAVSASGVPMLTVRDTLQAAHHACDLGLMDPLFLPSIQVERDRDEGAFAPRT